MSLNETVIEGTLKPDGTLELDEKPNLPAGRVKVVLRPEAAPEHPRPLAHAYFRVREEIRAEQRARGHVARGREEGDVERRALGEEMDEEIEAAIRLQEECRGRREQAESESNTP